MTYSRLAVLLFFSATSFDPSRAFSPQTHSTKPLLSRSETFTLSRCSPLFMQQQAGLQDDNPRQRQSSDLSAYASDISSFDDLAVDYSSPPKSAIPDTSLFEGFLLPVLSASFLITGNAVGAGMLVLPELAKNGGMALTAEVLLVAYIMNLISGLAVAQVAIQQHERSGSEAPSSFKEFSQANLPVSGAEHVVSGISIFINTLVLAFNTANAGQL